MKTKKYHNGKRLVWLLVGLFIVSIGDDNGKQSGGERVVQFLQGLVALEVVIRVGLPAPLVIWFLASRGWHHYNNGQ